METNYSIEELAIIAASQMILAEAQRWVERDVVIAAGETFSTNKAERGWAASVVEFAVEVIAEPTNYGFVRSLVNEIHVPTYAPYGYRQPVAAVAASMLALIDAAGVDASYDI